MDQLYTLAKELGVALKARGFMLALAESCTGGMAAQAVTSVAGSSAWFDRAFISYSNPAKMEMLGVKYETLQLFGAVSEQTAAEMAQGALKFSLARISASITGIAGPDGGSGEKPVGTVCFGFALENPAENTVKFVVKCNTQHFTGNRETIRQQASVYAITQLIELLQQS